MSIERMLDNILTTTRENIVDSLKLFCYGEAQTQTNKRSKGDGSEKRIEKV